MRLFVAIEIPEDIRARIASLLKEFRAISPHAKWVRPENLHLTLKFLGETDPSKLVEVQSSLASTCSAQPISIEFRGLGFFPNARRPRVFWLGIQSSAALANTVAAIDRAVHKLGFPLEDRLFTPHLTLARFNESSLAASWQSEITQKAVVSFGTFTATEFHLIESKLKSGGAEYTTLQSFPFVAEA